MGKYLVIYLGADANVGAPQLSEAEGQAFMDRWARWAETNRDAIVDAGAPVGGTKRVESGGAVDTRNRIVGYTLIEAASHAAAAQIFADHPHLGLSPHNAIEVMECLNMPGM